MTTAAGDKRWSYSTSQRMGLVGRLREFAHLYTYTLKSAEGIAEGTVGSFREMERVLLEHAGKRLENLRVLDIGPGQQLRHLRCASVQNDVIGIDMDIIPQGLNPLEYVQMLRHNSALRVAKTLVRKALFLDRKFEKALARRMGVRGFRKLPVVRMDATRMRFPDESFDVVFSNSAFEHIDDPGAALAEVARILKPGGVAHISLHQFTSHTGCHDPANMFDARPSPPYWPHLRAEHQASVNPSTYLNRLRLGDWRRLFAQKLPGVRFIYDKQQTLVEPLAELRAAGELGDYDDDELLAVNVIGVWQKGAEAMGEQPPTVRWVP